MCAVNILQKVAERRFGIDFRIQTILWFVIISNKQKLVYRAEVASPSLYTWMFPKIVVPPNHPLKIGFSITNHPFWGTPYFWKHPYTFFTPWLLRTHQRFGTFVGKPTPLVLQGENNTHGQVSKGFERFLRLQGRVPHGEVKGGWHR